jgi:DNA-binding response OmpR family regulator
MSATVLVVDDHPIVRVGIVKSLTAAGFSCIGQANSVKEAIAAIALHKPQVISVDLNLPDGDGMKLFAEMAKKTEWATLPVFILTAQSEMAQKVSAFSIGADDYIVKPFDAPELLARIDAKLRKIEMQKGAMDKIQLGDLLMSIPKQKVWLESSNGTLNIPLTSIEFKLLLNLLKAKGGVQTRTDLLREVWGEEMHVTDRTVDTHIGHLRKKIANSKVQIQTVVGEGYRVVV